jgi:hypothetical protein
MHWVILDIARVPWYTAVATDDLQRIGELLLRDGVGEGGHSLGVYLTARSFCACELSASDWADVPIGGPFSPVP